MNAYDKERLNDYLILNKELKCMYSGILVGEIKGTNFVPSINIALSKELDLSTVESVEVEYGNAIRFLKKEAIELPDSPKGYALVTYKGLGLGWVKNLGNRCNNLYPQEWRIRMKL